jgi:hypothetical protein
VEVQDWRLPPVEAATGIRPKEVTAGSIGERPVRVGWLGQLRTRREVAAIRRAVKAANSTPIRWADEGGVVYAEPSRGFEPLRAYAKWLDCREQFPEFGTPRMATTTGTR